MLDDDLDALSDASSTTLEEAAASDSSFVTTRLNNEVTEDLTTQTDAETSEEGSEIDKNSSNVLNDDVGPTETAPVRARAYQLEMLEESLKRNIIVAVSSRPFCRSSNTDLVYRWIQDLAKHMCIYLAFIFHI
jgi:hypothetical protein